MWSGAVTSDGARVKAKITGGSARLVVADNPGMSSPTFFGPVVPSLAIATLTATGLAPDEQYWYRIEDSGVIDASKTGRFHTHGPVGVPYSFTFAASSCGGYEPTYPAPAGLVPARISNHPVLDSIRLIDPLFFIDMGDRQYYNLGSGSFGVVGGGSLANFRRADDDVLAIPRRAALHRDVPTVWVWDDHDYGPNDADGTFVDKANSAAVYRERVPHYPLAQGSGAIYHEFKVGRVQFVVTDLRYHRASPASAAPRTILGATQLAWLDNLLTTSTSEVLVWVSSQPSNSGGPTSWGSYTEERDQIYQMFGDHGWIGRMCEIAGDQHQLSFDSGAHTAGFPLYTLGPIDSRSDGIVGQYDLGGRGGARGQFGTIRVTDTGQWITVTTSGWF